MLWERRALAPTDHRISMPLGTLSAGKPSAIALRHVVYEDLGLLAPVLSAAGWDAAYRDTPRDDLDDAAIDKADLLIVLGGPFGAYETASYPFLAKEIGILERRLAQNRPTLGICLGAQLMAAALGGRVYPGPVKEIGWGRVDLTEAGRQSCLGPLADASAEVVHWHGDTFDLPEGAVRLASNANYQNQAFAFGPDALALQFHMEADAVTLEKWYVGYAQDLPSGQISTAEFRARTAHVSVAAEARAAKIFSDWLHQIGQERPSTERSSKERSESDRAS
jgi:GMP synthase (glutamine-hydrolysing)